MRLARWTQAVHHARIFRSGISLQFGGELEYDAVGVTALLIDFHVPIAPRPIATHRVRSEGGSGEAD